MQRYPFHSFRGNKGRTGNRDREGQEKVHSLLVMVIDSLLSMVYDAVKAILSELEKKRRGKERAKVRLFLENQPCL